MGCRCVQKLVIRPSCAGSMLPPCLPLPLGTSTSEGPFSKAVIWAAWQWTILRSLRGLADAVDSGGHLVYTNQPWHPQVEFIARVPTNREGQPWIMRRRTQAEMDELVRNAGFQKISQVIDPWGIFTVSAARRVGS